ncbi:MAG TPA: DUF5073 family protein [Mycobacteriales bacterium]|jgi:hypothetical protein|nr:DUF5073 family protein [Mycobacteriales bacterium]
MSAGLDSGETVRVLTAVLGQTGGAETVIGQLGALPGADYTPPQPGGFLRRAEPSRLGLGDRAFSAPGKAGTQLQVSHVVRGIALQTKTLGPADAAESLVDGLRQLIESSGPDTADAVEAAIYGLAVAAGLR